MTLESSSPLVAVDRPRSFDAEMVVAPPLRLLHVFSSFGIGGVPLRMARIMNALGPSLRHSILALDGSFAAVAAIDAAVSCEVMPFPAAKAALPAALWQCRAALRQHRPDLLITYNWGAIEWAMANSLFARLPHIHHEAGFGKEETARQLPRRVRFRRWALRGTARIVVPSKTLERIARDVWRLPAAKILYLPNGVDLARYVPAGCREDRSVSAPLRIGTLAPLRPEKNVGRLVAAFAAASLAEAELVIAGGGAERPRLEAMARELGIANRVTFLGEVDCPEAVLRRLDIFALSSDTEQMPNAILEAMAAGLPVAAVGVGDVAMMVAPENRPFIAPPGDTEGLAAALVHFAADAAARRRIGAANLARVRAAYSQQAMFARWREVIAEVAGRSSES